MEAGVKETDHDIYGVIFKKDNHVAYCQVRGAMGEPGNWQTFKPVEFQYLSTKLPDRKYHLALLDAPDGSTGLPAFSITVKDLNLTKVHPQEQPILATAKTSELALKERARKIASTKRTASKTIGKDKEYEQER